VGPPRQLWQGEALPLVLGMIHIFLRWASGSTEYVNVIASWVRDGCLVLEVSRFEYRHIPLTALKEWTVEES
jgi:hypothetical protein